MFSFWLRSFLHSIFFFLFVPVSFLLCFSSWFLMKIGFLFSPPVFFQNCDLLKEQEMEEKSKLVKCLLAILARLWR